MKGSRSPSRFRFSYLYCRCEQARALGERRQVWGNISYTVPPHFLSGADISSIQQASSLGYVQISRFYSIKRIYISPSDQSVSGSSSWCSRGVGTGDGYDRPRSVSSLCLSARECRRRIGVRISRQLESEGARRCEFYTGSRSNAVDVVELDRGVSRVSVLVSGENDDFSTTTTARHSTTRPWIAPGVRCWQPVRAHVDRRWNRPVRCAIRRPWKGCGRE